MAIVKRPESQNAKRLAWGESSDVFLLPKGRRGARQRWGVLKIERRRYGVNVRPRFDDRFALTKWQGTALAHMVFPEHVVPISLPTTRKTAWPPEKGKRIAPRYYSPYRPLPANAEVEGARIRQLIRDAHAGKASHAVVRAEIKRFDNRMRRLFPALIPTVRKVGKAGVIVPHPEINFTVYRGGIVFYEVELRDTGKAIEAAFARAKKMPKPEAKRFIVQIAETVCEPELRVNKKISGHTQALLDQIIKNALQKKIIDFKEYAMLLRKTFGLYNRGAYRFPAIRFKAKTQ